MQSIRLFVLGAASAFVLAACAQPEPEPVTVEPLFNKLGAATCPASDPIMSTHANGQLSCVQSCREGYTTGRNPNGQLVCVPDRGCPPGTGSVAGGPQDECIPLRRGGDDPQTPGRPNPNSTPTRG
jgi:hypothetical protein